MTEKTEFMFPRSHMAEALHQGGHNRVSDKAVVTMSSGITHIMNQYLLDAARIAGEDKLKVVAPQHLIRAVQNGPYEALRKHFSGVYSDTPVPLVSVYETVKQERESQRQRKLAEKQTRIEERKKKSAEQDDKKEKKDEKEKSGKAVRTKKSAEEGKDKPYDKADKTKKVKKTSSE